MIANNGKMGEATTCIPGKATLGQITDIVGLYLENNPQTRHLGAATLVGLALAGAFPCRN